MIEGMFTQGCVQDACSLPTFRRALGDNRSLALRVAVENLDEASREVLELKSQAASFSGFPIRCRTTTDFDFSVT